MNGVFNIFQSIIDSQLRDVYLDALDEYQNVFQQTGTGTGENNVLMQAISSLLSKPELRLLGLQLLHKFLDRCTSETMERKANIWMGSALKSCSAPESNGHVGLAFTVMGQLARSAAQSSDLRKSFGSTYLLKMYEALVYVPEVELEQLAALRCVEVGLRFYPGSSGPARGLVERFLARFVDSTNGHISEYCGKCQHLLVQVRGGGVQGLSHKIQWKNFQLQLLGSLHAVLDVAYSKCVNAYEGPVETGQLNLPLLDLCDEPVDRAAQLLLRFGNLATYLVVALREPFPVEKAINPKKILNLISRGLSVTLAIIRSNDIIDNLALGILLPKIHFHLLEVLQALIETLGSHLRVYFQVILDLLAEVVKETDSKLPGSRNPLSTLRIKAYEVLSLWCKARRSGSCCETIAEFLVPQIIKDVSFFQSECVLQVLVGARKHLTKKARRDLHKVQNEHTNLVQSYGKDDTVGREKLPDEKNQALCAIALRFLQELLLSSGSYLKPTLLKTIETKILQICALFYEMPVQPHQLYHDPMCRLEIYNVLYSLVMTPHYCSPPPMQIIVSTLRTACLCDNSAEVRYGCAEMLSILEKLVHPQKEGLQFSIDIRRMHNAFIKLGKEHLLSSSPLVNCQLQGAEYNEASPNSQIAEGVAVNDDTSSEVDLCIGNVETDIRGCESPAVRNPLGMCTVKKEDNKYVDDQADNPTKQADNSNHRTADPISTDESLVVPAKKHKLDLVAEEAISYEKNNLGSACLATDEDVLMADIESCFVDELS